MPHPATEPSIRERLARALAANQYDESIGAGLDRSDFIDRLWSHRLTDVDAILAEQITALKWQDTLNPSYDLKAAIRVLNRIRDGGK